MLHEILEFLKQTFDKYGWGDTPISFTQPYINNALKGLGNRQFKIPLTQNFTLTWGHGQFYS